ncbi:MAG: AAA family ATPase [Eggerthellaceae bacterium]|nr:AAA family ATPase [Eggerthellaceae bacterium]
MLQRKALSQFEAWRARSDNHGLLVTGARQVGKTYLLEEFGRRAYANVVKFDLIENPAARRSFAQASSADDLAFRIGVMADAPLVPGNTLVIIDEVQECPEVITFAKYLVAEGAYDYAFSGSLLGVMLENIRSFPVGYVTEVEMRPLDFEEFTWASGLAPAAWDAVREAVVTARPVPDFLHERMLQLFRRYLLVGGMPDAVNAYIATNGIDASRTVQADIRRQYGIDITKYAPKGRRLVIRNIYDLIPAELSKQNRRFNLSDIEDVRRHDQVADDFLWLAAAGVALPAYNVSRPAYPLVVNDQRKLLKLFSNDVGLLTGTFLKRDAADLLDGRAKAALGGVYENFVAQELSARGFPLSYFTKKGIGELDIVTERGDGAVIAFEVKSGRGYRTHAALDNALAVGGYQIDEAYVLAECNVEGDGDVLYLPIYAVAALDRA